MRAVADNPMLADIKGINAEAVARIVSFVGMGLAGLGGMLIGLDTTIDPLTGFRAILSIFAAAVVGGLGSIPGAVVGALVVGIGEELSLLVPVARLPQRRRLLRHPAGADLPPARHPRPASAIRMDRTISSRWLSRRASTP